MTTEAPARSPGTPAPPLATSGRRWRANGDTIIDVCCLVVTSTLVILVATGRLNAVRDATALLFTIFVPGWVIVRNWPTMLARSRFAASVVFSITFVTLVATVMLWAHYWHPLGVLEAEGIASAGGLVGALVQRPRWKVVSEPRPVMTASTYRVSDKPAATPRNASPSRSVLERFRITDITLPASIALWAFGLHMVRAAHVGTFGLLALLPVVTYVGIGLLILSIGFALTSRTLSPVRLGMHVVALLVVLFGTAAFVYPLGRYEWLYQTIGIVQYVNRHGELNRHVDIYQNWPGAFALFAWFDKVAGVKSPLGYAKWAQLGFEMLTCLLLSFAFRAISVSDRERWLAIFIYAGAMWIGSDYMSTQALAIVLSAGVLALALHWLADDRSSAWVRRIDRGLRRMLRAPPEPGSTASGEPATAELAESRPDAGSRVLDHSKAGPVVLGAFFLTYFVLVFVHELTPYIVLVQVAALTVIGRLRPLWVPLGLAAIVFAYLLPRFGYVNAHYALIATLGHFLSNVRSPPFPPGHTSAEIVVASDCADALSLGVWLLGGIGAVRRWRAGKPVLALAALACAPGVVLFAVHYGGEAIHRVYLFSLPWTACLAASAIWPATTRAWRALLAVTTTMAIILGLFLVNFFADDAVNVMPPRQVHAVIRFYRSAQPGTVFAVDSNYPFGVTGNYNQFTQDVLFGPYGALKTQPLSPSEGGRLTRAVQDMNYTSGPSYVIISGTMITGAKAYGFPTQTHLRNLRRLLATTPGWFRVQHGDGVTVYELAP